MRRTFSESEWRAAKDECVKALATQQKEFGQIASQTACENFFNSEVVPQMRDVEFRQVRDSFYDKKPPEPEVLDADSERRPGDGRITSRGNVRGPNIPEGYKVVVGGEFKDPTPRYKSIDDWVVAHCFRVMRLQPVWKRRVMRVFKDLPPIATEAREKAFRKILDDWLHFYGPFENIKRAWLKGPERKRLYSVPSK